jgi:hypothetical protein
MTELPPDIRPGALWSIVAGRSAGSTVPAEQLPGPERRRRGARSGLGRHHQPAGQGPLGAVARRGPAGRGGGGDGPGHRDDGDPAPPPTTTVRTPLPTTTFEAPAPPGTKVALGNGWSVVVRGFNPDSTRALQPLNRDSPPLEKGQRRVMVDVEMTYLDGRAAAQAPFDGVDLAVLGDDGRLITPADTPCVPSAPTLDQSTELSRGATVRGRLCFAVDAAVVPTLRLVAEPSMTFGSEPSYLALLKRQA